MKQHKTLIIGSGAFSKALASILLYNNQFVNIYSINDLQIADFKEYFSELYQNKLIKANVNDVSKDIKKLFNDQIDIVIFCTPSHEINNIINLIKPYITPEMIVINTSKGLNWKSDELFYTDLISKQLNCHVCGLYGPSFAVDILEQEKTIINIVSENNEINETVELIFNNDYFRLVPANDLKAASLLSSLKNVLAILCGIANSFNCSNNTFSSILTIGIKEINHILNVLNINTKNMIDFCGVGDIFLTCTDKKSRNFNFGYQIGKFGVDKSLKLNHNILVEGLTTLNHLSKLINTNDQKQFPVMHTLTMILEKQIEPNQLIDYLWKII